MKLLALLIVLCASAGAQNGVYYQSNVTTSSKNTPPGAQAPVLTVPSAKITICANPPSPTGQVCTNKVAIYSDSALTQPITQPLIADTQGQYGFYIAVGTYAQSIQNSGGVYLATTPFTTAGGQVTAAQINALPGVLANVGSTNTVNSAPVQEVAMSTKQSLSAFLQCVHNARQQPCYINIPGDSRSTIDDTLIRGIVSNSAIYSDLPYGYRWADKLRRDLQAIYGSHGTGLNVLRTVIGQAVLDPDYYSISGGWTADTTLGPFLVQGGNPTGEGATVKMSSGTVLTYKHPEIAWDTLRVFCETQSGSGSLAISIDGVSKGSACAATTSSPAASAPTFGPVSLATHTATLTCTGTCYVYALEGIAGTSGVSVSNIAVGGVPMEWFSYNTTTQFAFSDLVPHQLDIVNQGTNEPGNNNSTGLYLQSLTNLYTHETAQGASILFVTPGQDNINANAWWSVQKTYAQSVNAAFIDYRDRYGPNQITSLFGPDGIHENKAGNAEAAAMIEATLLDGNQTPSFRKSCPVAQTQSGVDKFGFPVCTTPETQRVCLAANYTAAVNLTIPHTVVQDNLTNFPWMFSFNGDSANSITFTDLKSVANGGKIATATATDTIFCQGGFQLPHELVDTTYSPTTGSGEWFVRIPQLSTTTDTVVTMYVGNPNAPDTSLPATVWANGYAAVYHFCKAGCSHLFTDSTGNGNLLLPSGGEGQASGQFGGYITMAASSVPRVYATKGLSGNTDARTVEGWYNNSSGTTTLAPFGYGSYLRDSSFTPLQQSGGPTQITLQTPGLAPFMSATIDSNWHFLAYGLQDGSPDATSVQFFYDGAVAATQCTYSPGCSRDFKTETTPITLNGEDGGLFAGGMYADEFRISNVFRSRQWLGTEYLNLTNPNEVTVGAESTVTSTSCTSPALPHFINGLFVGCS